MVKEKVEKAYFQNLLDISALTSQNQL